MDIENELKVLREFVKNNQFTVNRKDFFVCSVIDILENLNENTDQNTTMIDEETSRSDHHIAIINGLVSRITDLEYENTEPKPPDELKPCLNCGWTVEYCESKDYAYPGQDSRSIKCNGCGLLLEVPKRTSTKQMLINRWNRRSNA